MAEVTTSSNGSPRAMGDAARGAVEALADLTREHIELAKIEVGRELRTTLDRSMWFAAGGITAGFAGLLLLAAIFALLGYLIDSVGWRLLILAALVGVASFALILRGSVIRPPEQGPGANGA
jgi:hypothetical protein